MEIPVKCSLINVYGIEFRFKTPVFPLKTFRKKPSSIATLALLNFNYFKFPKKNFKVKYIYKFQVILDKRYQHDALSFLQLPKEGKT